MGIILGVVETYQTLIAAAIALLGAWWTVGKLNDQIRQTQDIENDRRERRNLAARTVMPAALAALIDYATACLQLLEQLQPDRDYGLIEAPPGIAPPPVPAEALLTLWECIEFGEKSAANVIADMISKIQIQQSRLVSIVRRLEGGEIVTQANIDTYVVDALEIHARASKLFPYARRDLTGAGPETPTVDDLRRSAWLCRIGEDRDGVQEYIGRWKPNLERA